ncbi:MerR family transcriptional regulator [Hyphococcus sp.]|uniref:helix-turn-helix domain-containing protein n=1 Tax=Hyphococcus sp. TaxID=2038636 RepID=UPI003D113C55
MQIGAVAELLGITSSAIRYYERKGLIQPVMRVGGRREFDSEAIATLRFLKLAQAAGFTLSETRQLLNIGFGDNRPQKDWLSFLHKKRSAVREKMEEIEHMDALLVKFESCMCPSLEECMEAAGRHDKPTCAA